MTYLNRRKKIREIRFACGFGKNFLEPRLVDVLLVLPDMPIHLSHQRGFLVLDAGIYWDLTRDLLDEQSQPTVEWIHDKLVPHDTP